MPNWTHVYLLFAGAHRLEELAPGGRWHDYFISVRGLSVSYLDPLDARRLLTNPTPDFPLQYAPGTVDELIRLTRCQPYLVQLMGRVLVDWLNNPARRQQGDWLTVTSEDINHAASEALRAGQPYFFNLWDNAGDDGRRVLAVLAETAQGQPLSELMRTSVLPPDDLPTVLHRLSQHMLTLEKADRWRIQVELTRRAFAMFAKTSKYAPTSMQHRK